MNLHIDDYQEQEIEGNTEKLTSYDLESRPKTNFSGGFMPSHYSHSKVGIYVDTANLYSNGGSKMQYDVLREFACRDYGEPVRLNAYVTYDVQRSETDRAYRRGALNFHSALRNFGYKVIIKKVWIPETIGGWFLSSVALPSKTRAFNRFLTA